MSKMDCASFAVHEVLEPTYNRRGVVIGSNWDSNDDLVDCAPSGLSQSSLSSPSSSPTKKVKKKVPKESKEIAPMNDAHIMKRGANRYMLSSFFGSKSEMSISHLSP